MLGASVRQVGKTFIKKGEVDFLVEHIEKVSLIEIKFGKTIYVIEP